LKHGPIFQDRPRRIDQEEVRTLTGLRAGVRRGYANPATCGGRPRAKAGYFAKQNEKPQSSIHANPLIRPRPGGHLQAVFSAHCSEPGGRPAVIPSPRITAMAWSGITAECGKRRMVYRCRNLLHDSHVLWQGASIGSTHSDGLCLRKLPTKTCWTRLAVRVARFVGLRHGGPIDFLLPTSTSMSTMLTCGLRSVHPVDSASHMANSSWKSWTPLPLRLLIGTL